MHRKVHVRFGPGATGEGPANGGHLASGLPVLVHGVGDLVEVDAYVDPANIRIEVTDDGGSTVPHHVDDPHGEHGRGLPILAMLARSWGFEQLDDGRLRVWFEVPHTAVPNGREAAEANASRAAATPSRLDGTHEETALSVNRPAHCEDG